MKYLLLVIAVGLSPASPDSSMKMRGVSRDSVECLVVCVFNCWLWFLFR